LLNLSDFEIVFEFNRFLSLITSFATDVKSFVMNERLGSDLGFNENEVVGISVYSLGEAISKSAKFPDLIKILS
jgi:hypothetical protein